MDVIYGDDEPFYGFERVQGGKVLEAVDKKWESVDLAIRRGSYSELPLVYRGTVSKKLIKQNHRRLMS